MFLPARRYIVPAFRVLATIFRSLMLTHGPAQWTFTEEVKAGEVQDVTAVVAVI